MSASWSQLGYVSPDMKSNADSSNDFYADKIVMRVECLGLLHRRPDHPRLHDEEDLPHGAALRA